ncbi:MAG: hypothetical protein HW407_1440 [Bacteroidetes bacterium]|nr:hypothetical protein [Bacteroidota bacterium]
MKPVLLTLLLSLFVWSLAPAQDEQPIPPQRSRAAKVGAFGGFIPGWLFVDVKPINEFLVPSRGGGLGMSGSIKSTALDAAGIRRDAQLKVGFGGVTLEYVVPIVERLDLSVGTMLGGGGIDIILRQDAGGAKTWGQEWGYFESGNYGTAAQINSVKRTLTGAFFVWVPSVNIEYAILGWVGVRLGATYVGMSAPSWTVDDNYELLGVPNKVNGQGFMINAGLFVGTF